MREPVPPLQPGRYKGGRNPEPSTPRPADSPRPMGVPAWVIQKPEPPQPPRA
jgi:hypothetical protein